MEIGYFSYHLSGAGPRVRARTIIKGLAERTGHDLTTITSRNESFAHPDVEIHKILSKRSLCLPSTLGKVRRLLGQADVVHVPVNFYQLIYVWALYNGPLVAGAGLQRGYQRVIERLNICMIIDTSEYIDVWDGYDIQWTYIYPAVDETLFRPYDESRISDIRTSMGIPTDADVVLFVGKLKELKGAHLLGAFAEMMADEDTVVVVVGDGPMRERFEGRDDLIFEGFVDNEDLPRYYNMADITIVPSREESFSIVSLESAACGTPVVTTTKDDCRMAKIFKDRGTYVWTDERSADDLACQVRLLLEDSRRYAAQVERGFETIEELGLTLEHTIDKYVRVYEDCI